MVEHGEVFALLPQLIALWLQDAHEDVHGDLDHVLPARALWGAGERPYEPESETPHTRTSIMRQEMAYLPFPGEGKWEPLVHQLAYSAKEQVPGGLEQTLP